MNVLQLFRMFLLLLPVGCGIAIGGALNSYSETFWGVSVVVSGLAITFLWAMKLQVARFYVISSSVVDDCRHLAVQTAVEQQAALALAQRFPGIYMPLSAWSMRASNIQGLLSLCDSIQPCTIVELGSGVSTLYVAAWLKQSGRGKLISFDHEAEWAQLCNDSLCHCGLADFAEVRVAPLHTIPDTSATPWYQIDGLSDDIDAVDLLIVDGPPAGRANIATSREPAVDVFYERLTERAAVFLDDGSRPGERTVVSNWVNKFADLKATEYQSFSGYWLLRRTANPTHAHARVALKVAAISA
jgi:hypothetical protein